PSVAARQSESYKHPISTGPLGGANNKHRTMKRMADGFRDQEFSELKIYGPARRRRLGSGEPKIAVPHCDGNTAFWSSPLVRPPRPAALTDRRPRAGSRELM
ncbi:MAG: hypothetical protein JWO38_7917, partial [Gemmataceae bacterium]|nr:hypothetical protein [Gemmataceae bacterium]